METVQKDRVVAFSFVAVDENGAELERSSPDNPTVYLHGHDNLLRGLETALEGKSVGEAFSVTLEPERAYGYRRDNAIQRIPIKHLLTRAKRYQPGMVVKVETNRGPRNVTIVKVGKFNVDVDTNHPFAGKTITFDIVVENTRDPQPDELAHRHAHGWDGQGPH